MRKIHYFNLFDLKNPAGDVTKTIIFEKSDAQLSRELNELLAIVNENDTFARRVRFYMHKKHLSSKDLYDKAYIDRRLLHKIIKNPSYHTSKKTAFSLCIVFELSYMEAVEFISLAGYSFSPNDRFDCAIKYFIKEGINDLDTINELLYAASLPCFGE